MTIDDVDGVVSIMHRYITGPFIIGILVFLFVLFVIPILVSETGIVSAVVKSALSISNNLFAVMPPLIVDFTGNLNLPLAALALGLTITIAFQLVDHAVNSVTHS